MIKDQLNNQITNMVQDLIQVDADGAVSNLELETDANFLLETGGFIILE